MDLKARPKKINGRFRHFAFHRRDFTVKMEGMSEKKPIRLVTVDDLPLMRSGLRAFLTAYEEFSLVGEASNGEEAIQLCELLQPDIVLMDLKMPVMDGVEATRQIHQRWPQIKVLALISFRDKELVDEASKPAPPGTP